MTRGVKNAVTSDKVKVPYKGTRTVKPKAPPIDKVTITKIETRNSMKALAAEINARSGNSFNVLVKLLSEMNFASLGGVTISEAINRISQKVYDESMWFDIWNAVETYFEKESYDRRMKAREARAAKKAS